MTKPVRPKREARLDLNPSSAERWVTCTASPHFIMENWDKVPSDENKFNQEGTTAHEVAAAFLQERKPDEKDSYKCPVPVTPEMRVHAYHYAEYVTGLMAERGVLIVEKKYPLWYMLERNAMIDAAVINPGSFHIVDFKYGEGIVVSPVANSQAVIYAMAVLSSFKAPPDDFPIFIHIYQPRGRAAEEGAEHVWQTTAKEIRELANNIFLAAKIIQRNIKGDIEFAPSPKACQWCPAKGFCSARQAQFSKDVPTLATIPAGDKHLPPVKAVSMAQLAAILKHKKAIEKWLNDAEEYAHQFLSGGGSIPGYKLVTGREGNRYWSNPAQAAKLLLEQTHLRKEEVIEERVQGPAAIEKLLGKNKFTVEVLDLIARPPGKPTIAPEDDPRESCLIDGAKEFENEEI